MPVVGLPTTLEVTLDALLQHQVPTSWKVTGEGDATVVVIRLTGQPHPAIEQSQPRRYRRKPPSQVNRDRRRAEERRKKAEERTEASEHFVESNEQSPSALFQPTPEVVTHQQDSRRHGAANDTPVSARAARSPCNSDTASQLDAALDTSEPECDPCNIPSPTDQLSDSLDESEIVATEVGYDIQEIKTYVGEIMNKSLQNRLRDTRRNTGFRKVVCDGNGELLCDSDDVIFVIGETGRIRTWFFKQEERERLTEEEWAWQASLRTMEPVDRGPSRDQCQETETQDLPVVMDLVRYYLG